LFFGGRIYRYAPICLRPVLSGELDQQNLVPTNKGMAGTGIEQRLLLAQTFTAGHSGELDKVSVVLSANTSGPIPGAGNMVAEIYPTDSSGNLNTSTQPLGSGSTPSSSIIPERAQSVDINLSQSAPVTEGTLYARRKYHGAVLRTD
jgi:hypothetical protein